LPYIVASIIASLVATKVGTAWTHAAVSTQRDGRLWKKLPSYLTILRATALPLVAEAVVTEAISAVAFLPLGPRTGSVDPMGIIPQFAHGTNFTRLSVFIVVFFTLYTFLMVPTEVVLTRMRASSMKPPFFVY
jgi:preprotein translocase subunit SecY